MKAAHTPGPWHWPHDSNELCPVNPDHEHMAVSSILYADGGYGFLGRSTADTQAELDADRRLIAAAPDLLAALRDAHAALSAIQLSPNHRRDVLAAAADAITKATGAAA